MKRTFSATAAAVALLIASTAASLAADLPVKARPYIAPVPVYSWTGFYVGGNLGYGIGLNSTSEDIVAGPGIGIVSAGTPLYGGPIGFDNDHRGVIGGAQIGYNWQFSSAGLFGLEADIQGSDMRRGKNCILPCNIPTGITSNPLSSLFPVTFADNSFSQRLDWFGTVRGRIGYVAGPALFYATGGLAYGDVERRGSVAGRTDFPLLALLTGCIPPCTINTFSGSFASRSIRTGWTVGGGVEAKLFGNWSAKAEYLYMDLGNVSDTFNTVFLPGSGGQTGQVAAVRTITSELREHIFRVGLNYQFNTSMTPVVAKY